MASAIAAWQRGEHKVRKTESLIRKAGLRWGSLPRRTRRPASWRSFSEVSVAGVAAALDSRSPLLRRILWSIVLVVCTLLMLLQCRDRVIRYISEPVNVNVRITHNNSLEFPAITVCNKNTFNRSAALELMIQYKLLPPGSNDTLVNISRLVGVNGMLPEKIWGLLAQRMDIFISSCWFGRGVTCDGRGNWTLVHTVIGPCYTFMLNETYVNNVGTFHNLFIRFQETTPIVRKDDSGVRVLVHERRVSPVLAARTDSMSVELGWSRDVKMELRKFYTLNTDSTPCKVNVEYSELNCLLDCFQRAMFETTNCRIPYMSGSLQQSQRECSTPEEYEEAMNAISSMLLFGSWSAKSCQCPHECHKTAFQLYPENIVFKDNEIKLRIFYENLVYEQITEEKAYTTISLLCDIGGTLGLLMGASVLTVCELLEVAWSHLFLRTLCHLQDGSVPSPVTKPVDSSKSFPHIKRHNSFLRK